MLLCLMLICIFFSGCLLCVLKLLKRCDDYISYLQGYMTSHFDDFDFGWWEDE